jgi:ABC-type dipeptide/oligopeptide/nickel transport system ATPase component
MESAETQTQETSSVAPSLILDSLEIQGFRGFRHLRIERLGRVNLIVGKNSVGKTALLEAIRLYAYQGSPSVVTEILEARDKHVRGNYFAEPDIAAFYWNLKYLFYGRKENWEGVEPIRIGRVNSQDETISLSLGWFTVEENEEGRRELREINVGEEDAFENVTIRLIAQKGAQPKVKYRMFSRSPRRESIEITKPICIFTPANGLNPVEIGKLWDNITQTDLEKDVLKSLQIIAPRLEGVSLVSHDARRERVPIVRLAGVDQPPPLRSLGDGMNRLFGIALALVNAKDGMLLIDEVENGLHYSVQPDVWKLIFETARNLNVQVFATTHSWDCIEAFQKAAQESPEDGMLIRLAERQGNIISDVFSEKELGIATKRQIELR